MRAVFHRTELLGAARRGESIAPHDSPLDVLKGLLFEAEAVSGVLTMTATNLEITLEQKIPCPVPEDDAFVLNARLAVSMLERLAGDTVELEHIPGMARRTVFAAAEDDSKPLLKCVNLKFTKDGLRAAVGNGSCVVTAKGDIRVPATSACWFPPSPWKSWPGCAATRMSSGWAPPERPSSF